MKKQVYLGLLIFKIRKTITHGFYMKPKHREINKVMLYVYMDNFIILILTGNIYVDIRKMLKQDMILQIVKLKNHYLEGKKGYSDQ